MDFQQKYYDQITKIKMPEQWVSIATKELGEGNAHLAANISNVEEEDAMDFEAYTGVIVAEQAENQELSTTTRFGTNDTVAQA
ncbi:uncharacterized protein RHO25_009009 [Cercospora beticola]|uniref:Uncharacterized protein n=1 Tax=Cercospora beticola TaxID=122368 RepID=A0ABZ0NXX9_CERBT|nr:hypothetical protein RHO25_009009 [Cercospora beticola]CAK1356812.1 unnamed protein product [Cercospora beticola]